MTVRTFGEKAVGITFNPSNNQDVNDIKLGFANIIDRLHELQRDIDSPDIKRMLAIAITESQTAQMWAVKAVTWGDD